MGDNFEFAPCGRAFEALPLALLKYWPCEAAALVRAMYISEQGIEVVFSEPVLQNSPLQPHDALNPALWTVSRTDGSPMSDVLTVISGDTTDHVILRLASPGATIYDTVRVRADTAIQTVSGRNISRAANEALCLGPVEPPTAVEAVNRAVGLRDLSEVMAGDAAGSLVTTSSGDYAIASAEETMRALIIRTLSTVAGEFVHAPTYGGLGRGLKAPFRSSDLERLAREGKRAIEALPGVIGASLDATMRPDGVLVVQARVRTRHLGTMTVGWTLGQGG